MACRVCEQMCSEEAISVTSHAVIDKNNCIECNDCIDICPAHAIKLNRLNSEEFSKALVEYAYANFQIKNLIK